MHSPSALFRRTILSLLFTAIAILGCAAENKDVVYLVLKTMGNPFFVDIADGATWAAKDRFEVRVRAGNSESDVETQISILQGITTSSDLGRVAGIIVAPCSSGPELVPHLKVLKGKRPTLPIVLVDTRIGPEYLTKEGLEQLPFFASDNFEGGMSAARFIVGHLKRERPNILILTGVESQETAIQRRDGFLKELGKKHPDALLEIRSANWQRLEALQIVASLIAAGRTYDGVFASNDEMALGAAQAYLNARISAPPVIVGFDATDEAREAVRKHTLTATIAQSPAKMGSMAIEFIRSGGVMVPTSLVAK